MLRVEPWQLVLCDSTLTCQENGISYISFPKISINLSIFISFILIQHNLQILLPLQMQVTFAKSFNVLNNAA